MADSVGDKMNEEFQQSIMPVLDEVNQLVRTAWALQKKTRDHRTATVECSDVERAVELTCLDALRRETISSLCRLDDPAQEYMSLRHAVDLFAKAGGADAKIVSELQANLRMFREKINTFKVSHRNS